MGLQKPLRTYAKISPGGDGGKHKPSIKMSQEPTPVKVVVNSSQEDRDPFIPVPDKQLRRFQSPEKPSSPLHNKAKIIADASSPASSHTSSPVKAERRNRLSTSTHLGAKKKLDLGAGRTNSTEFDFDHQEPRRKAKAKKSPLSTEQQRIADNIVNLVDDCKEESSAKKKGKKTGVASSKKPLADEDEESVLENVSPIHDKGRGRLVGKRSSRVMDDEDEDSAQDHASASKTKGRGRPAGNRVDDGGEKRGRLAGKRLDDEGEDPDREDASASKAKGRGRPTGKRVDDEGEDPDHHKNASASKTKGRGRPVGKRVDDEGEDPDQEDASASKAKGRGRPAGNGVDDEGEDPDQDDASASKAKGRGRPVGKRVDDEGEDSDHHKNASASKAKKRGRPPGEKIKAPLESPHPSSSSKKRKAEVVKVTRNIHDDSSEFDHDNEPALERPFKRNAAAPPAKEGKEAKAKAKPASTKNDVSGAGDSDSNFMEISSEKLTAKKSKGDKGKKKTAKKIDRKDVVCNLDPVLAAIFQDDEHREQDVDELKKQIQEEDADMKECEALQEMSKIEKQLIMKEVVADKKEGGKNAPPKWFKQYDHQENWQIVFNEGLDFLLGELKHKGVTEEKIRTLLTCKGFENGLGKKFDSREKEKIKAAADRYVNALRRESKR